MSLRNKMLFAVVGVMILVVSLLTLNLWTNALWRMGEERNLKAELALAVVQAWLTDPQGSTRYDPAEGWAVLSRRFGTSGLFDEWVVIDDRYQPLTYSQNFPRDEFAALARDERMREAIELHTLRARGDYVYAPLPTLDGHWVAARLKINPYFLPRSDPMESFKGMLGVMALGTILLILNVYILLSRFVLRPLDQLVDASRRVAHGDYSRPIPPPTRYDELAELIKAFNTMMSSLREMHANLEAKVQEARLRVRNTERRLVVAQRLSATGTLAAGIAHEINNPLGGMLNAARAMRKQDLDPAKREQYVNLIAEGLARIQETVKKVLSFSPSRQVHPQAVSINNIVHRAVALGRHRLETCGIRLAVQIAPSIPAVYGDPAELQQVFLNLLLNAIDASPRHDGEIDIEAENRDGEVLTHIIDNGRGMTDEEVSRAFDLFYTTKPSGEGTGMGLSVVHNIVQNHNGRIEIESAPGLGTRVTVALPVADATAPSSSEWSNETP